MFLVLCGLKNCPCFYAGDPAVSYHAIRCAGGHPPIHARACAHPGEEGRAYPGGYPSVLRAGGA